MDLAVGELQHVGLGDDDGSGCLETRGDGGVVVRDEVAQDRRAGSGCRACGVDQVLEREWDAVQRPSVAAASDLRFCLLRVIHRLLGHDRHVGIELRIARCDDGELLLHQFDRRQLPVPDGVRGFRERETAANSLMPVTCSVRDVEGGEWLQFRCFKLHEVGEIGEERLQARRSSSRRPGGNRRR